MRMRKGNKMPNPGRRTNSSETGVMPRVDLEPEAPHEPPPPPTLPEFDDDGSSITGRMPAPSEGEDKAKQSDDSATASYV